MCSICVDFKLGNLTRHEAIRAYSELVVTGTEEQKEEYKAHRKELIEVLNSEIE